MAPLLIIWISLLPSTIADLPSGTAMFNLYPALFRLLERANPFTEHELIFSVKQQNIEQLKTRLLSVSNITSPDYGHYLSRDEVASLTSNPSATKSITNYLQKKGISTRTTQYGEYVIATAPLYTWEVIFRTVFYTVTNGDTKAVGSQPRQTAFRALRYYTPKELQPHLLAVFNIVETPSFNKQKNTISGEALSEENIQAVSMKSSELLEKKSNKDRSRAYVTGFTYPRLINEYYNITSNIGSERASQAVFETSGQTFSTVDMAIFESAFDLPIAQPTTDINDHISKTACQGVRRCAEANLDVQYLMAIAQNIPTTFWYTDESTSAAFTNWLVEVADVSQPPKVISISYSISEHYLTFYEVVIFDIEAVKLLAQGITILAAAGDAGVTGDGLGHSYCGYNPVFPASSIYVTAVGGTQGPERGRAEVACQSDFMSAFTTGGGFSNLYQMPAWQKLSHASYFAQSAAPPPFVNISNEKNRGGIFPFPGYNAKGRGYPDIAMLGVKYIVAINGSFYPVDGTSASCPVVAAMVSLVNSERIRAGKPTLGWLNPALYSPAFHGFASDITVGENKCLKVEDKCCMEGFTATPGWDPVTGWGSVDYVKFKTFFLALKIQPMHKKSTSFDIWRHRYDRSYLLRFFCLVMICSFLFLCCMYVFIRKVLSPYSSTPGSATYGSITNRTDEEQAERNNVI